MFFNPKPPAPAPVCPQNEDMRAILRGQAEMLRRLVRVETRIVNLLTASGLAPDGRSLHQFEKRDGTV